MTASPASLDARRAALADRCRLERELGVVRMATVYLALDVRHDRLRREPRFRALLKALNSP